MATSATQTQASQPSESNSGTQLYQRRQPEKESLYRILLHNVETFLHSYPRPPSESSSTSMQTQGADKPKSSGPRFLRKEIRTTMEAYLRCGVHQYGFSRLKCDDCGFERLVPFSCRKRGLCASCHAKTLTHWSEWLLTELLPNVPYRQWVITVPKRIRPFFQYDPNLNKHFSQIVANLLQRWMQTLLGRSILRPLMIVADQSFGTLLNLHPHQHWIISDGAFAIDGSFYPLPRMQKKVREQLTRILQRKVLNWLVRQGKLSAEERRRMLRWRHTGFSIDTSVRIREDRRQELEKLLCYIRRHPFRLSGFSYNPQHGVVLYHAPKMHGTESG